uniref:ribose-5-phosphate isomerase n=1 Tax=Fibrocapsa japonica TaxID=94617 RepID=A0A7S2XWD1_9STRA|mmetsp:Transcript_19005/g.27404  ORF Transcript_19005/g.27404 Transcript_19005/m.27404 type:complete len:246 (+) Transcript_19005:83-820(+)|eukprot:CAMPEP_0113944234 /NCGR_PEP_ID=MMETSP1339-20121228/31968_1 /TAXON_ID=94617 /ORGANISM="Fibrocapsa japonica" /LENGTH=245 /DNA_ID=CAMNT_0000949363 /DNA_START=44 /DNA_END=781 /DNA_ORIENTATION=- /assembly_acc=CAM_ASM_000762
MAAQLGAQELKKQVGYKSVDDHVKSGMVVGLGTGSTAYFAVERLGQKLASGELENIVAIPTSTATAEQASSLNIPLVTLDSHPVVDVAIDGADEVATPSLDLVKGRGGALLREKMVEIRAKTFICIVDESKFVTGIGASGGQTPVEVAQFCWQATLGSLQALPSLQPNFKEAKLRMNSAGDTPYVTDNGNFIVDLFFDGPILDPAAAAEEILHIVGVVEHGLFLGMANVVISASAEGGIRVIEKA